MSMVAEGLVRETPSGPRLIGGRRRTDGKIVFPMPSGGEAALFEAIDLADHGTLWSFTIQRFRPKSPPYAGADDDRSFKPFALGYVELADQVIVEARLDTDDFAALKVGQPLALTLTPFPTTSDPNAVTFAFKPLA